MVAALRALADGVEACKVEITEVAAEHGYQVHDTFRVGVRFALFGREMFDEIVDALSRR